MFSGASGVPGFSDGIVCGYHTQCNIVLPSKPGILPFHGCFDLNVHNRLFYRDLSSHYGTEV